MTRRTLAVIAFAALTARAEAQAPQPRPAPARPATAADPAPQPAAANPGGQRQLPPLPAHLQKAPTPKTPSPGFVLASFREGRIYLRSVLPFPKPGSPAGGGANVELASVAEPFEARQIQARTANGEAVRPEVLAERLATETPVLVGFTGQEPDSTYLKALKDDSLVILLPAPQGSPDEGVPALTEPAPAAAPAPAPRPAAPARPATAPAPRPSSPAPKAPR